MTPNIFLFGLAIMAILVLGFYTRNWLITIMGAMGLMIYGINIALYGILGLNNLMSDALAVIFMAVGGYITIQAGLEQVSKEGV